MNLEFQYPALLWLLLLIPLIAFFKGKSGKLATILFSNVNIARDVTKKTQNHTGKFLAFMRLLAFAFLIIAIAGPRSGSEYKEQEASGVDIILAIDVSSSMLALDFSKGNEPITRIDAVKGVIKEFIKKRKSDRIGIVAFAGNPYLVSPLTLNHDWLTTNLERIRVGMIEDGTAIGSAIGTSVNRLRDIQSKSKIVILLTDGVNNTGVINPISAAEAAATFKTKIYTIAAGSGGVTPALYLDANKQIAKDRRGRPIVIQTEIPVDEESLKEIARLTDGQFFRARDTQQLENIYQEIDALEKTEIKIRQVVLYNDLFFWPACIALLLLLLEILLSQTIFRRLP